MYLADVFPRSGRDLFADLERLLTETEHSLATSSTTGLDLWANEDALQVALDAPGLDPASIDLSVLGDTLTIRAATSGTEADQQRSWLRRERPSGTFARSVHLPYAVDSERAEARYRDGVLTITLHRQAGSKPQRITVQAA